MSKSAFCFILLFVLFIITFTFAETKQLNGSIIGIMPKQVYLQIEDTVKEGEIITVIRNNNEVAKLKIIKINGKTILTEIIQQTDKENIKFTDKIVKEIVTENTQKINTNETNNKTTEENKTTATTLTLPTSNNIAVMPFKNVTADESKNWIGAGFSSTITTKLGNVKKISVIEREQLSDVLKEIGFQQSGFVDEKTAVQVGKIYGVGVMVLGEYQIAGDILRVNARYVNVETAQIIATTDVKGSMNEIFSLQDKIAFNLIDNLKIVLGEKEKEEIKINPTKNLIAYEWFGKGNEADDLQLYDKAIEYYTKAIELDSKFASAYYFRGNVYYDKEDYDKAIADYNKAIELNPEDIGYFSRGVAYYYTGDCDKALQDYNKAIELNPQDDADSLGVYYYFRGLVFTCKDKYDSAIADFNKTIELELNTKFFGANIVAAYWRRGTAYYYKGENDKAIKDFNKAIELNPQETEAYLYRGVVYYSKGENDKALQDYNKAIELDPEDAEAYNKRGIIYCEKGDYDSAINDFNKAIELNPKDASAYFLRGVVYYSKKNEKFCISDWKKAVDLGSEEAREALKENFKIDY